MIKRAFVRIRSHPVIFYPVCAAVTAALLFTAGAKWLYIGIAAAVLFAVRPGSPLHRITVEKDTAGKTVCTVITAAVTVAACVFPMSLSPVWNGEIPGHRNQYELMAEAVLDGRIDIVYGDEDELARLENPYDPAERAETGVKYHWDHAFYKGHYYMYFGVVPVFLVFIPYRLITGRSLTTYHATQLFTAFIIIGIFILFRMLAKLFFKELPYSVYIVASVAFSVVSVWFAVAQPALYCTAITGAVALEIWSLYFLIRAVWGEKRENRQIMLAAAGSLTGALAFGCRPPVALANILVIPMLAVFLRGKKFSFKLLWKLTLAALPYVIVGAALMCYNYARFENPFEFGQAYQITVADQTGYGFRIDKRMLLRIANEVPANFFALGKITENFPYLQGGGVFYNFPMLLAVFGVFGRNIIKRARENRLLPLMFGTFACVALISVVQVMMSPYIIERYRTDIYFLMAILCFIVAGLRYSSLTGRGRRILAFAFSAMAAASAAGAVLLYIRAVGWDDPHTVDVIRNILNFA